MIAFCFRSGHIGFGRAVPEGAIEIIRGKAAEIRAAVEGACRWSYPTKRGGSDEVPLVPGIPEAKSEMAAFDALIAFRNRMRARTAPKSAKRLRHHVEAVS